MIGKIIYALTWPASSITLRILQGPKVERKARKAQAKDYMRNR